MEDWVTDCIIQTMACNIAGANALVCAKEAATAHGDAATAWSIDQINKTKRPDKIQLALDAYAAVGGALAALSTQLTPPPIANEPEYMAWRLLHPAVGACSRLNVKLHNNVVGAVKHAFDKKFISTRADLLKKLADRLLAHTTAFPKHN